ncbi:hypothetical protein P7C71_g1203, partial [Lecanoromycetidae sp. Uapishka_2]
MSLVNLWHLRKVAEASAKSCDICYKPTTSVLITPDNKIQALTNKQTPTVADDIPRIYTLQKVFYQKRLDRIRNAEIAKRNKERLKNPTMFPSVPRNSLG